MSVPFGLRGLSRVLIPIAILALGLALAIYLVHNRPAVQRSGPEPAKAAIVKTLALNSTSVRTRLEAMGTVIPAKETVIKAQVAGEVLQVHPKWGPGAYVHKGQTLVRLDDRDYLLALKQKKSALQEAQADLDLEEGQQEIARQEWEMAVAADQGLNGTASALALRRPQLEKSRAKVQEAQAALEQARLDLSRTRIKAPFAGLITSTRVETGSLVASQGQLASLVSTRAYWVQARVSIDRLMAAGLPPGRVRGAPARVVSQTSDLSWSGQVLRCTGSVQGQAKMAEVLIEVPDPLGLQDGQAGQLLLGDYVEVQISGQSLQDVAVLPRSALHSGDRLWLAVNDRLQIRQVRVLWKDTTKIVVPFEFSKDTRLVVSDLNTPVEGMALRRAEELQIKPDRKGTPAKGLERLGGQS